MKKVSIIVPNYNHARYLRERLDSIFAQDYPQKEIILLDDASTDESVAILQEYAKRPEVKTLLVNERNSGNTFRQWERGLQEATGDYVWIAESDDLAAPEMLSQLVQGLDNSGAVMAFCHSRKIDTLGYPLLTSTTGIWQRDFLMVGEVFVRRYLLGYSYVCNASAVVFRRDAAMQVDMREVEKYPASGDRLFWIEIAMQGTVGYLAKEMNSFRQHPHKVSGSAESLGRNMEQDHAIYDRMNRRLRLSWPERVLACGYHWRAIHQPAVTPEGRERAMRAWRKEEEFGRPAYWLYMLTRIMEKING